MIDVFTRLRVLLICLCIGMSAISGDATAAPRMRPYTGVGLIVFAQSDSGEQALDLPLYDEPGIGRVGVLNKSRLPGNEWVLGVQEHSPLIVSSRKGEWCRITYDDAGREAWVDPENRGRFQTWELFLKQQPCSLLPGLQPRFYQLLEQPGGKLIDTLTAKLIFKAIKLENEWIMVLVDQERIGWVRWRDEDGRLLVGTGNR